MGTRTLKRLARRAVIAYSIHSRRRKADLITAFMRECGAHTLLLSGIGSGTEANEAIIERAMDAHGKVMAAYDIQRMQHPNWPVVMGDGRALPFRTDSVDLIVANAVIEHVGGEAEQRRFVAEHVRVGHDWVITTPNRWFPVESHTSMPFLHWRRSWRDTRPEFTRLLSRLEFRALLPEGTRIVGRPWSATFIAFSS